MTGLAAWLLVFAGGMVGASLRYLADRTIRARTDAVFPWGTFSVNLAGSLILGLLAGAFTTEGSASHLRLLLGTGLCGALTTYSMFSYETLRLAENGARFLAAANGLVSILAGLGAVVTGAALAETFWT